MVPDDHGLEIWPPEHLGNRKQLGFYLLLGDINEDLSDDRAFQNWLLLQMKNSGRIFDGSRTSDCCAGRHYDRSTATGIACPRRAAERVGSQTEGSVNSDTVSEHAVSEEDHKWVAPELAELSAEETIPRVSRLTALIVMMTLSLGTWAAIWAAVASLCRG
jgi:hypothetical protein